MGEPYQEINNSEVNNKQFILRHVIEIHDFFIGEICEGEKK